jgi:hypothetical protein
MFCLNSLLSHNRVPFKRTKKHDLTKTGSPGENLWSWDLMLWALKKLRNDDTHLGRQGTDWPASCNPKDNGGRGVTLTSHFQLVPRLNNAWIYTSTLPIHLHCVVLSLKRAKGQLYLTFKDEDGAVSFATVYRPALEPLQSSVKRVPGCLYSWVKRPGSEGDRSPPI